MLLSIIPPLLFLPSIKSPTITSPETVPPSLVPSPNIPLYFIPPGFSSQLQLKMAWSKTIFFIYIYSSQNVSEFYIVIGFFKKNVILGDFSVKK